MTISYPKAVAKAWHQYRATLWSNAIPAQSLESYLKKLSRLTWVPDELTSENFQFLVPDEPVVDPVNFADPAWLETMDRLTGMGPFRHFEGTLKMMDPAHPHRFPWHSDRSAGRRVGLSLNLSTQAFQGGVFEQRRKWERTSEVQLRPTSLGDLHLFDVHDPTLVHRITSVTGTHPRVFFAGWFYA